MSGGATRRTIGLGAGALAGAGAGALAACGASGAAGGGTGGQGAGAASGTPKSLAVAANTGAGTQLEAWKPIWPAWEQQYPQIKLETLTGIAGTDEFRVKLVAALAGGTNYDALHIHHILSGEFMAKSLLRPLDGIIGKDKDVRLEDFPALLAGAYRWRGKQYGVPIEANPWAVDFNADLFAQQGVKTPAELARDNAWTWDQLLATAKQMTRGQGEEKTWGYGGFGRGTGYWGWTYWLPVVWSQGGDLWNKDATAFGLDGKEGLAGVQFFADLMLKHEVAPPVDQGKLWDNATGRVGLGSFAPFTVPNFKTYSWKPGMATNPRGPAGANHASGSSMFGIYAKAKLPDEAWLWTKWISDQGVKTWLDTGGFTAPTRKSLTQYRGWTSSRQPWESVDAWTRAVETLRLPLAVPGWDPAIKALAVQIDQALLGKLAVEQALQQAKVEVNAILKAEGVA
jgi:multiple sugar transport system substrate-binding protein